VYDSSTNRVSKIPEISVPGDVLHQGPLVGTEREVVHDYSEGRICQFHCVSDFPVEHETPHSGAFYVRFEGTRVASVIEPPLDQNDPEVTMSEIRVYALGGLGVCMTLTTSVLEYNAFLHGLDDDALWESHHCAGGRYLSLQYSDGTDPELPAGEISYSESRKFPSIDDSFELTLNPATGLGEFIATVEVEEWTYWDGFRTWSFQTPMAFLPVMPTVTSELDFGSRRGTIEAEVLDIIQGLQSEIRRSTKPDGVFTSILTAVESCRAIDINGLAFVNDLLKLRSFLEPVLKLLRKPTSPRAWAQLLLWIRYGVKLSISDIKELLNALLHLAKTGRGIRDWAKSRRSLMCRYGTVEEAMDLPEKFLGGSCRSNARLVATPVYPPWWGDLTQLLNDLDFRISAKNLWDLIPWSFVVDWFLPVEAIARDIDYIIDSARLRLRELVLSQRTDAVSSQIAVWRKPFLFVGCLHHQTYTRGVSTSFPTPPFVLGAPSFRDHLDELGLIIVSKGKH